jgi:cobalt-zinc-cadmium efflux system outer membrane protein
MGEGTRQTMSKGLAAALTLSAMIGQIATAQAEEPPPHGEGVVARPERAVAVGRREAIRMSTVRGPGVAVAQAPLPSFRDALRASRPWLAFAPQLTVGVGPRSVSPAGARGGLDVQVTALVPMPTRGLQQARGEAAQAQLEATTRDLQRSRSEAALRGAISWSRSLEARELLRLRRDAQAGAEAVATAVKKRVNAGVGAPAELALALGDLGLARAATLDAEGQLTESLAELRLALGLPQETEIDVAGDPYAREAPPAVSRERARREAAARGPLLPLAEARALAARREIALTHATQGPTFSVGASYQREGTGDQLVLGLLSLPLPLVDQTAFDTARSAALSHQADAQLARAQAETDKDISLSLHDIEHTREVRDALETGALRPLDDALRLARVQLDAGTGDVLLVLAARQRLVAVREALLHACGEVQRADLRLQGLIGALDEATP